MQVYTNTSIHGYELTVQSKQKLNVRNLHFECTVCSKKFVYYYGKVNTSND